MEKGGSIIAVTQAAIESLLQHNRSLLASLGFGLLWGLYVWRRKRSLGHLMEASTMNPVASAYDFIIVGGGSAACVLANRLSEDPTCRVLLVSEGKMVLDHVSIKTPLGWGSPWFSNMDYNMRSTPQAKLDDREVEIHRPHLMGGCGASDTLLYLRGEKQDYDSWAEDLKLEGWSYEELLPFFKKSERFFGDQSDHRGTSGELEVRSAVPTKFGNAFLEGCQQAGIPSRFKDCNSHNPLSGAYLAQNTITRNHERAYGPVSFLRPIHELRTNLTVKPDALVHRVIIKDDQVVGVEWENLMTGEGAIVKAKKEVILAAGPMGSAQLLMLSGIGPEDNLKEVGVDLVRNLPVGKYLQDQLILGLNFVPTRLTDSLDFVSFWDMIRYGYLKSGQFIRPLIEAFAFERFISKQDDSETSASRTNTEWTRPSVQHFAVPRNSKKIFDPSSTTHPCGLSILSVLLHPKSKGKLELAKNSVYHHMKIDPNYLDDEEDEQNLIQAAKRAKEISDTESFRSLHNNQFLSDLPESVDAEDQPHDDAFWKAYVSRNVASAGFTIGTCRMGNDESDSVVNHELKVHGIKGLRVADTSVVPTFVSSCAPRAVSMMVAEKAAFLIKKEHNLF